jgi:hypothetical protein
MAGRTIPSIGVWESENHRLPLGSNAIAFGPSRVDDVTCRIGVGADVDARSVFTPSSESPVPEKMFAIQSAPVGDDAVYTTLAFAV